MSRYHISADDPTLEVVVGWDDPLTTFFANIIRPAPNDAPEEIDDEHIMMVGIKVDEIKTIEELESILGKYNVEIPKSIKVKMYEDSQQPYEFSPLQQFFREIMKSSESYRED